MSDSTVITFLLGLLVVCACVLTGTVVVTARQLRGTLRRLNTVLPAAEQALQEAHRSLRQVHRLLATANGAVERVDAVTHRAIDAATGAAEWVAQWKRRAQRLFSEHAGNGAGADPRSHRRSRNV